MLNKPLLDTRTFTVDQLARRMFPSADNPQGSLGVVVKMVNATGKMQLGEVAPDRYTKIGVPVIRAMIARDPNGSLQRSLQDMLDGLPIPGSLEWLRMRQTEERKAREAADPVRRAVRGVK